MCSAPREVTMTADTPGDRQRLLVAQIVEARRADEQVRFAADGVELEYHDRVIRLELSTIERDRLESLLDAYHVFKIEQPATRKADDDVVYLSAVTDAKHAADFIEAMFREVYGLGERYTLSARK